MNATYFDDVFFGHGDEQAAGVIRGDAHYVWIRPVGSLYFPDVLLTADRVVAVVEAAVPLILPEHRGKIAALIGIDQQAIAMSNDDILVAALRELTESDVEMLYELIGDELESAHSAHSDQVDNVYPVFAKVRKIREEMNK